MSNLAIIGTGYVGLTTGAVMAHLGHQVTCADLDPAKVEKLNQAELHIYEPGLRELVVAGLASGRLRFVVGAAEAAEACEFAFLCVQTPQGADGEADLTWVLAAAAELGHIVPPGTVVINKSTVPVGSAARVAAALARPDVTVASNPEFLREGTALADCLNPDRIVVGAPDVAAAQAVAALYDGITAPVVITDVTSAEMIKYASNAFLAVKLSYVNEIAALCERVGADALDVVQGMGFDQRIGKDALKPGPGWGGSCLPKDTAALAHMAATAGAPAGVLQAAMHANNEQRRRVVAKVTAAVPNGLHGARVAVWGLTFKANTDDLRDSPSLAVIQVLQQLGATVVAHDPQVEAAPLEGLLLASEPLLACEQADVLVVLTEWPQFAAIDLAEAAARMTGREIVDARNLLDRSAAVAAGFHYVGLGR
ncbi:MAG: UDP-glucose/GDP-mannose dehydrogenase family protein [Actinomycetota bacterium]|nr:UDP-glucose/GDP-mannose dehydrogenase family protein [Actinomycetota bacterium]